MRRAAIFFNENISNENDVFDLFEANEVNVEKALIRNWDAVEEIIRDALNYHNFHLVVFDLTKAKIRRDSFENLSKILMNSAIDARSGSVRVEY